MMVDIDECLSNLEDTFRAIILENYELKQQLNSKSSESEAIIKLTRENNELLRQCHRYGLNDKNYNDLMRWWHSHLEEKHKAEVDLDHVENKERLFGHKDNPYHRYKPKYAPSYLIEISEIEEGTCYSIICKECGARYVIFV